jgi:multiple antibiotic resistance protein
MMLASLPFDFLVPALVTLLVVIDPIGLVPAFLAVTHGLPEKNRLQVALRACLIATTILTGAALIGNWLLHALSITLPAFRIAGGLLLFSIASEMVFGVRVTRQTEAAEQAIEERVRNIAAFPLGIPLMAGPAAITASVLLSGRAGGDPIKLGMLFAVIVAIMLLCLAVFLMATRLGKLLGATANMVLSRLLGVLLAALAVQFVIDGVRATIAG